ncbi:hypothetical protein PR048_002415, partial [Dryococelus australis]
MCNGRLNENKAIYLYEILYKVKVEPCRLTVKKPIPYLGASHDGLIGNNGLVEVNCLPCVTTKITGAAKTGQLCVHYENGFMYLKKNNKYWYQIQEVLRGRRDNNFWEAKLFPKLREFYLNCFLPEITDSLILRWIRLCVRAYIRQEQQRKIKK